MSGILDTCNEALAEIGAGSIAALDEPSVEAAACKRFYAPTVRDLIEVHDWGFTIRRAQLARLINDRQYQWMYAYARPADVGSLIAILPPDARLCEELGPIRYQEDGGIIYTNVAGAVLEYTTQAIGPAEMPALFRRALVYELAARLAMPVVKDRRIKGDMIQLAEATRLRAMADDMNRNPQRQIRYVDEVTRERLGLASGPAATPFEPIDEIAITIVNEG